MHDGAKHSPTKVASTQFVTKAYNVAVLDPPLLSVHCSLSLGKIKVCSESKEDL